MGPGKKKILLIDASSAGLMVGKMILGKGRLRCGHCSQRARGAREGARRAAGSHRHERRRRHSAAGAQGPRACEALRAHEGTRATPILLVTTRAAGAASGARGRRPCSAPTGWRLRLRDQADQRPGATHQGAQPARRSEPGSVRGGKDERSRQPAQARGGQDRARDGQGADGGAGGGARALRCRASGTCTNATRIWCASRSRGSASPRRCSAKRSSRRSRRSWSTSSAPKSSRSSSSPEMDGDVDSLRLVHVRGISESSPRLARAAGPIRYALGVGQTLVARSRRKGAEDVDGGLTAAIPLKLDGHVTGAVAIFGLVEHKKALAPVDHELFEVISRQAAMALIRPRLARCGPRCGLLRGRRSGPAAGAAGLRIRPGRSTSRERHEGRRRSPAGCSTPSRRR